MNPQSTNIIIDISNLSRNTKPCNSPRCSIPVNTLTQVATSQAQLPKNDVTSETTIHVTRRIFLYIYLLLFMQKTV